MRMISGGAIVAAVLAGIPGAFATPAPAPTAHRLVVSAHEFSFQAPDSIVAGVVTVRLLNRGEIGHQLALARLDDSSSITRVMRSLVANRAHTGGIRWFGGVEGAVPGETAETTVLLPSGRYVLVCSFEADNGHAHVSMGMIRALVVTAAASSAAATLPATTTTIRLSDYRFDLSGSLHAGQQLVRVENNGAHRHHLNIARIVGNATLAEIDKWDGKSKPSPLDDVSGGVAVLDPGGVSLIDLKLSPGRYLFSCVLSDDANSQPHFMLGMEQEITIK